MQYEPERAKQARAVETLEKIVQSGTELFCRDGFFITSAKKIAKQAGVATGTFYLHFADKKALLLEIHRRHSNLVHEIVERFLTQEITASLNVADHRSVMQKMVQLVYETHQLSPALHREITVLSLTDPDFAEMDREEKKRAHEQLSNVLLPFSEKLRVDDIEAAEVVVAQTIEAVVHSLIMFGTDISTERLLDALADMLTRYLYRS